MATFFGLLAILAWGLLASLSVYSKAIAPFQLLALCFFIASCLIYIYRAIKGQTLFTKPRMNRLQWAVGIGGIFGFHFLYFIAIRYAPAIEVSLISYLWPLLLGIYVAPKAALGRAMVGGFLGFFGVIILIKGNISFHFSATTFIGYLCALGCAFIWSAYSWFLSKQKSHTGDIAWITLACSLLALISHVMFEPVHWAFTTIEWVSALLLGLGPIGGAFYLWEIGMKAGNQRLLASFSFCTPVISALALYLFGISGFSLEIIIALLFILLGASIANSKSRALRGSLFNESKG